MKKILVISYYWPPSGGAGVHRWLGFVKYLQMQGHKMVVYTPENPDAAVEDTSLINEIPKDVEVIKQSIWEPYSYYKKLIGQKKDEKINPGFLTEKKKPGLAENFAVWVRGNLFIPDARKFWIKPSIKFLKKYILSNDIDLIISTGPPHSMHLIGLGLKKALGIKWIADFRDPWTNIDFYDQLKLSAASDRKHRKLEKEVLEKADLTIAVGNTLASELKELGASNVHVVTNGFDGTIVQSKVIPGKFTIGHFGSFTASRNPSTLWKVLSDLCNENKEFQNDLRIELVGKVDLSIQSDIEKHGLNDHVQKVGQVDYSEAQERMEKCQVLLLVANDTPNAKGILTSKMFEYMRTSRPILAIGPQDSDMSSVMQDAFACKTIEYKDEDGMKKEVNLLYEKYKKGELKVDGTKINKYHREELSKSLHCYINQIL